jgi:hypothetical protein
MHSAARNNGDSLYWVYFYDHLDDGFAVQYHNFNNSEMLMF